ncbi:interleukin-12 subunit beta [Dunckerocampus dactyliophorus]|uniref:interleukin-12 subunit beta n=1 Tax=Dunckerocampus dactyliophorus TaxID=161453 RepID=UPI0024054E1D|nr:interleukin-12 subunit beta [Dunckerocampus dactyliophorus]
MVSDLEVQSVIPEASHPAADVPIKRRSLQPDEEFTRTAQRSMLIFGLLFLSLIRANELKYFPKSYVMAKGSDSVMLPCGTKSQTNVMWKFENGVVDSMDGPNLLVKHVDELTLGEYTCLSENEKASTFLLMEDENEEELDSLLSCRARSYDCAFNCRWNDNKYEAVRLGLGPHCRDGGDPCQWVYSTHQSQDGSFHFRLTHSLTPYAEESSMLELTAEAIRGNYILRRTKRFYLRNIIQPDSPIVSWQEVGRNINVTIHPPSSWSTPHSFFSLEHQIQYEHKDDGKWHLSSIPMIPKQITKLRAQSRDLLVQSAWSEWTSWAYTTM